MGGHPPCRDHVTWGVTSRHVGDLRSYIIHELSEGSSHQVLSCSRVAAEKREELLRRVAVVLLWRSEELLFLLL